MNPLLSDGGMSTMIGGGKGVDHGLVRNLQRMQARTEVSTDRALIAAFRELGQICTAMKLLDTVKKQAEEFYKQVEPASGASRQPVEPSWERHVLRVAAQHTSAASPNRSAPRRTTTPRASRARARRRCCRQSCSWPAATPATRAPSKRLWRWCPRPA